MLPPVRPAATVVSGPATVNGTSYIQNVPGAGSYPNDGFIYSHPTADGGLGIGIGSNGANGDLTISNAQMQNPIVSADVSKFMESGAGLSGSDATNALHTFESTVATDSGTVTANTEQVKSPQLASAPTQTSQAGSDGDKDDHKTAAGECNESVSMSLAFSCKGTRSFQEAAKVTTAATTVAAQTATQISGQASYAQAQQAGTQSSALQGAATTERNTGRMQMVAGALELGLGMMAYQKSVKHNHNADQIYDEVVQPKGSVFGDGGDKLVSNSDLVASLKEKHDAQFQPIDQSFAAKKKRPMLGSGRSSTG